MKQQAYIYTCNYVNPDWMRNTKLNWRWIPLRSNILSYQRQTHPIMTPAGFWVLDCGHYSWGLCTPIPTQTNTAQQTHHQLSHMHLSGRVKKTLTGMDTQGQLRPLCEMLQQPAAISSILQLPKTLFHSNIVCVCKVVLVLIRLCRCVVEGLNGWNRFSEHFPTVCI